MRGAVFLVFCMLVGIPDLYAASVTVTTDREELTVGDEVILTYTVRTGKEERALFPKPHTMDLGDFRLKKAKKFVRRQKGEGIVWQQALIVTTFDTEERTVPAQKFVIVQGDEKQTLVSEPVTLTVTSVLAQDPEAKDIRGLKGQRSLVVWVLRLMWIILLAIAAAVLIWFLKKRRKEAPGLAPEPALPAHEVALAELQTLQHAKFLEKGRVKEYFIRLSGIVRKYLEGRYGILGLDRTTDELIVEMKTHEIERDSIRLTREFLAECDLVKFAKFKPQDSDSQDAFKMAVRLVETTKPRPAPVENVP